MNIFSVLYWNLPKSFSISKVVPFKINWYGVCFSLGILITCTVAISISSIVFKRLTNPSFEKKVFNTALEDFALYSILIIVPTARLGHVFFYDWAYYSNNLFEIFKIWNGGLASHGGIIGLVVWSIIYSRLIRRKIPVMSFLFFLDLISLSFGFAAFLIRLGNLFAQEILGTPTTLPWGIIFSDPIDGLVGVARHPVQLYEGLGYLFTSLILIRCFMKNMIKVGSGMATALAFISISFVRFSAEFIKIQHHHLYFGWISKGQILSIPLFLIGVLLILRIRYLNKSERQLFR